MAWNSWKQRLKSNTNTQMMLPNKNGDQITLQNYTFKEETGVRDTHQWKS